MSDITDVERGISNRGRSQRGISEQAGNPGTILGTESRQGVKYAKYRAEKGTWVSASLAQQGYDKLYGKDVAYGANLGLVLGSDGKPLITPDKIKPGQEYLVPIGTAINFDGTNGQAAINKETQERLPTIGKTSQTIESFQEMADSRGTKGSRPTLQDRGTGFKGRRPAGNLSRTKPSEEKKTNLVYSQAPGAEGKREIDKNNVTQDAHSKLGLIENNVYEFKDAAKKSSWIKVGKNTVTFIGQSKKPFLMLKYDTMKEILVTTGDKLQDASSKYTSSTQFREKLVERYYDYFVRSEGNRTAKNQIGLGQFRYEISEQHLSDSVWNELEHVFKKTGQKDLEKVLSKMADKNPGMECYGTTMLNIFKSRGLVPPSTTRTEFEKQYADIFTSLPKPYRHHVLVGGGGGVKETKEILETLITKLSKHDWAKFTGMDSRNANVQILSQEKEIEREVKKGYVVFVGVPGHYKAAVGGEENKLKYDDPLGWWGHILYDNKRAAFGVVAE